MCAGGMLVHNVEIEVCIMDCETHGARLSRHTTHAGKCSLPLSTSAHRPLAFTRCACSSAITTSSPPRAEHCRAAITFLPSCLAQYGPATANELPVTGSSQLSVAGAQNRTAMSCLSSSSVGKVLTNQCLHQGCRDVT